MLNLAEMAHFCQSLGSRWFSDYETARDALYSSMGCPETRACAISALLLARRGQHGPHGLRSQPQATACDLEFTRHRAPSAAALARVKN